MFLASSVGIIGALTGNRTTFTYVNVADNGVYGKIWVFDPAKCVNVAINSCSYTSTTDLGDYATISVLNAAGATPSTMKKKYTL
ncbi:hypothetical protein [Chryseobacterium sp. 22543]|uniref:hypothetical protein n=1 Tax=Chryseobacterium sp. 22543 TaxID=3453940 RepID=UPI003F8537F6